MKNKNYLFMILLLVIAGCSGGGKQSADTDDLIIVDVTASYPKKELILQDFMDVEYIPLETGGVFYCQGIVQAIGKEMILVTNRNNDGDIFIFDRNGKGLRKFNRQGRGAEEYTGIREIIVDEENGEILINDNQVKKILVYDLFGMFKRSFSYHGENSYRNIYNYDRNNLICHNDFSFADDAMDEKPSFLIVSKKDGDVIKEIRIPFENKKTLSMIAVNGNSMNAASMKNIDPSSIKNISVVRIANFPIIPVHDTWILTEPSSDTVFKFLPDYGMIPFMARIPAVQSMDPETFLLPNILTDRYYFMKTEKKEYDFTANKGFPKTYLVYDRQEKTIHEYTVYNGDYSNKKTVDMVQKTINNEIAFAQSINADDLVESLEKGHLKGHLKEIAEGLEEEANPVIMLVKHKKN